MECSVKVVLVDEPFGSGDIDARGVPDGFSVNVEPPRVLVSLHHHSAVAIAVRLDFKIPIGEGREEVLYDPFAGFTEREVLRKVITANVILVKFSHSY